MSNLSKNVFENLKYDIPAGIVVFLVAVPLCLGIALASGAPLFSGIIAGIVGGIIVGSLSGSPLGVSGPAAGLAIIVLYAIRDIGAFDAFLVAVVIGGVLQLALGFARAGIIGYYFPTSVIKGMLSGIGVTIFIKQIPHAFGYDKEYEGNLAFFQADGETTLSELGNMLNFITPGAVIVTIVSLGILILWEQKFMKNIKLFQIIQGPLIAILASVGLTIIFNSLNTFVLEKEHLVSIPIPDNVNVFMGLFTIPSFKEFLGLFTFPDFSKITNPQVLLTGFTIAIVASLETLLCVEATDKLDPYKRITPTNRELKAQGIGNIISGLIGGLPVTQVIVRSSANIQSGGRTKTSAIFHGCLILVSVIFIPIILNLIPKASLAAILLLVGYKLAKPSLFKAMYQKGLSQFIPYIVTVLGIYFTDLLVGISLGLAVAIFYILYNNYKKPFFFNPDHHTPGSPIRLELAEDVTFINKASILRTLKYIPDNAHVIIDYSKTINMDQDIVEIIEDFEQNAKHRNIKLEVIEYPTPEFPNPVKMVSNVVSPESDRSKKVNKK